MNGLCGVQGGEGYTLMVKIPLTANGVWVQKERIVRVALGDGQLQPNLGLIIIRSWFWLASSIYVHAPIRTNLGCIRSSLASAHVRYT